MIAPTDTTPAQGPQGINVPTSASGIFQPGADVLQSACTGTILAASPFTVLARVLDSNGALISPSSVSSITATVTDVVTDTSVSETFTPANVVLTSTVADGRWTVDPVGYNLALPFAPTAAPTPAHTYVVDATITPADGSSPFLVQWNLQT